MGGMIGEVAGGIKQVGSLLGKGAEKADGFVKDAVTGDAAKIGDSGFSVGDMKGMGYTADQIGQMGPTHLGAGTRLFDGLAKGGLQGFSNQQKQNGQQQGGGQQQISVQQAPQLQNGFDPNYLMKLKQQQQGGNGFYGGY